MVEKQNIIWVVILLALLALLYLNMCGKSKPDDLLNKALLELDSAQKNLDNALAHIDSTRLVIDSMQKNLNDFQHSVSAMRLDVQQLNISSKSSTTLFKGALKDLKDRNQKILEQLKVKRDSLPDIKIIN
jgi:peptidoglycan hydrolase CwlO-like protein